jgi:tetratricopeptide (TPR) repeat protein
VAWVPARRRAYVPTSARQLLPAIDVPLPPAAPTILIGVAAAIALCAFLARGGTQLERTTWTYVLLMLAAGALCAAALVVPRDPRTPARLRGIWLIGAFALLVAFTAFSVTWSLTPNESWLETNRMLAYLAVLAGGLALGRLAPGRWAALLAGVAVAAVLLCLWALLTKVFPGALAADENFARLRAPFEYWNSVGLSAALGIPPLLWLSARRSGHGAINVLAWPALGLLIMCLLLAFSRGSLLAVVIGLALWLAVVPLRLRALATLGGVLVTTVPLAIWAFTQDGLSEDGVPLAVRIDAGQALGGLLLLLIATLTIAGLAVGFLSAVHPPSARTRRRATRTLIAALAAVPIVALLLLATGPGGIDGQISKAWKQATDPAAALPDNSPDRLADTSSVRARYWQEASKIHGNHALIGAGAGAYGQLRLQYRQNRGVVRHAHGYTSQVLADLGWVGIGLSLLAVAAFLAAAARVLGVTRSLLRAPWDAERVGVATLAVVVIVFGIHSTIDWTWYVPGNAVPALLCAGFVASRTTLRERVTGAVEPPSEYSFPPGVRLAGAALVLVIALTAAWSALQPVRSVNATDVAQARFERGETVAAASIARIASERNPLSVDPLFQLSAIQVSTGNVPEAQRALERAVELEPANPEVYRQLGRLRLDQRNDARGALRAFQYAYFLDPQAAQSVNDVVVTARIVAAQGG